MPSEFPLVSKYILPKNKPERYTNLVDRLWRETYKVIRNYYTNLSELINPKSYIGYYSEYSPFETEEESYTFAKNKFLEYIARLNKTKKLIEEVRSAHDLLKSAKEESGTEETKITLEEISKTITKFNQAYDKIQETIPAISNEEIVPFLV